MTTVLIADDHRLFTDLVSAFLVARGIELAGVAATEAEAVARTRATRPDVCLVDAAALSAGPAETLVARLATCAADTRVVVLTASVDDPGPRAAAEAGAAGHLLKTASGDDLVEAVTRVARGDTCFEDTPEGDTEPTTDRPDGPVDETAEARRRFAALRLRERECLELIVRGASTEEMAETMGVTVATVRSHVRAVLAALDVHSRLGAASFALRHGVVAAGETSDRAG